MPWPKGLDEGVDLAVRILMAGGVETYESCQGGEGHSYPEPTVAFYGLRTEGFRALAWATTYGLKPRELRRVWHVVDGELTGPHWHMTFRLDDISALGAQLRGETP